MRLKQKPSNKLHRRYLLIQGSDKNTIERVILDYVGILGWAKSNPIFVHDSELNEKGIVLAVDRKSLDDIRGAFEISNEKIKILRVSGTLKGLGKWLYQKEDRYKWVLEWYFQ